MDCPKCLGKLKEKNVENVKVDACWICEGIWFDAEEFEKVITADATNFKNIDIDRDELDGKEAENLKKELDSKIGTCPKCAGAPRLQREPYPRGITVDVCPQCKGIWLDGGEIHKLRDRLFVKLFDGVKAIKENFAASLQSFFNRPRRQF